jgi:hypothetical protein
VAAPIEYAWQTLLEHDSPCARPGQAAPHAPQFAASVATLVHAPPHSDGTAPLQPQAPPWHVSPPVHEKFAPHPPQLGALGMAFVVSLMHVPLHAARPVGHCTVTDSLVLVVAPVVASVMVTLTVTVPGAAYVWVPETVNVPPEPVGVTRDVAPSPQVITAESTLATSPVATSVTVAIAPEKALPAAGVNAIGVAASCTLQAPAPLHTMFVPHPVPAGAFAIVSTHMLWPEAHESVPRWHAFAVGMQEPPLVQAEQTPALHTLPVPHDVPS